MANAGMQIDHIVIGVRDLGAAAQFEDRYGLTAIEGGRHPGWGTANRLVPLGAAYLELVTGVDEAEASNSDFGRLATFAKRADAELAHRWSDRSGAG